MADLDESLLEPTIAAPAAAAPLLGPPPSSGAPGPIQEPPTQPGPDDQQPDEVDHGVQEFDPRYKEPFNGLLYLGRLEDTVTIWGHSFRLVTPSQLEKLEAGVVHKPYIDTVASEIAYTTILVSSYLVEIDGQPLPIPITHDTKKNGVAERFAWVGENLRGAVIDELFSRCMILEAQVSQVLQTMGKAQG